MNPKSQVLQIPERCECYREIFCFVKEYAEGLARDGESIRVDINDPRGCYGIYISIHYDTIVNKRHIGEFAHVSPHFLGSTISRKCVKVVIDDIIGGWRTKRGRWV